MIGLLLFAAAAIADQKPAVACVPSANGRQDLVESALPENRLLRAALGESMPTSATMITLFAMGGHMATSEYSLVLARDERAVWHGTVVGRSKIWVQDAPYQTAPRVAWTLDKAQGKLLDRALSRRCRPARDTDRSVDAGPPSRNFVPERIDVVRPGKERVTFYSSEAEGLTALIRPPRSRAAVRSGAR